jgi:undecaprenyl-diphosphatase
LRPLSVSAVLTHDIRVRPFDTLVLLVAPMPLYIAILLGIVEGLTEYLPVSSTGHLVLAGHLLGLNDDDPATSSFEIVVQLGAILAVVAHYRTLLAEKIRGLMTRDAASVQLLTALVVAFVPAAVTGLLLRKTIKAHLFGPIPVAAALVIGGVVMIAVERWLAHRNRGSHLRLDARHGVDSGGSGGLGGEDGLERVTPKRALAIGLGQCLSLWPGASRSMCTILAGQLVGLSTATAAEFSFLLALPTLGAATLFEAYKARADLASHVGGASIAVGLGVSFFVAWAVIATFLRYLRSRGLEPFGWYRIAAGLVVFWALSR